MAVAHETDEARRAKKLAQVRALLAKADGTEFEGEAKVFRMKADALMTQFMIEEWELKDPNRANRKPVKRMYEMDWYKGEFADRFWSLFCNVARHCRVEIANMYFTGHSIPLVGLETDMDYCDMLFTNCMIELMKRINPQPSRDLDFEENLVMLKEAGMGWQEITVLMYEHGLLPFASEVEEVAREKAVRPYSNPSAPEAEERIKRIVKNTLKSDVKWYGRCAHAYRRYCKRTGHPQDYANYATYRKNFADGFNYKIGSRLREMRREQEVEEQDDNHAALVIRDIRRTVQDAMFEMFPKQQSKAAVRYTRQVGKVDYAARRQGEKAGAEARLHVDPQHGLRERKQIKGG